MNTLQSIVKTVAPVLASALGGPMAGAAVSAISMGIFGEKNVSEEEIIETLKDPSMVIKLKQIETNFLLEQEKLAIEKGYQKLEEISLMYDDIKNARARNNQSNKNGKTDWMTIIIPVSVILLLTGIVFGLFVTNIEGSTKDVIYLIVGSIMTSFGSIVTFYYGSSQGSKSKDYIINQISKSIDK